VAHFIKIFHTNKPKKKYFCRLSQTQKWLNFFPTFQDCVGTQTVSWLQSLKFWCVKEGGQLPSHVAHHWKQWYTIHTKQQHNFSESSWKPCEHTLKIWFWKTHWCFEVYSVLRWGFGRLQTWKFCRIKIYQVLRQCPGWPH